MDFKELAYKRRSIRKYRAEKIPEEIIRDIIDTAVAAPSGCNSQCWRFVVVTDRDILEKMAGAVMEKYCTLLEGTDELEDLNYMSSRKKMSGFFAGAPVVIAVFMTELVFYDTRLLKALGNKGISSITFNEMLMYPDLLSIGAAVQNLLLAAAEKGIGACWMNEPAIAGKEIGEILKRSSGEKLVSLIPLGYPDYIPREKKMKSLDEIFTMFD